MLFICLELSWLFGWLLLVFLFGVVGGVCFVGLLWLLFYLFSLAWIVDLWIVCGRVWVCVCGLLVSLFAGFVVVIWLVTLYVWFVLMCGSGFACLLWLDLFGLIGLLVFSYLGFDFDDLVIGVFLLGVRLL